jgi:hypothetical protein
MPAGSGGGACLQKAELRHWRDTLHLPISTEGSECSGLESAIGCRRHENYTSSLHAALIEDNQQTICMPQFQRLYSFVTHSSWCEPWIEVKNIRMEMIQFVSILHFIQMKLMKVCSSKKNKVNKTFRHFAEAQLIELHVIHFIGNRVSRAAS